MEKIINRLKKLPEPKKTYLEILKVHQKEVPLANLLAFFFRPKEKHNLSDLFIKTLLNSDCTSLRKEDSSNNVPEKVFFNSYIKEKKVNLDYCSIEDVRAVSYTHLTLPTILRV